MKQKTTDKLLSAVGIVDIARAVPDIKNLTGLSQRAEQRVVAALAFLLPVEANRGALGKATRGNNRAVKIESDPWQPLLARPINYQLPVQLAQIVNSAEIHPRQSAAQRSYIGHPGYAQYPPYHRVVLVIAHILQSPIPNRQVNNQYQHDQPVAVNGADFEMTEAGRP